MKIQNLFVIVAATVASSFTSLAQPNPTPNVPVEQLERTQREMQLQKSAPLDLTTTTTAPEMYPGENTDVGPQRILKTQPPRRKWFEIVADSQLFYSDNVFLSDENKVDAPLWVNTIQAAFAPDAFNIGPGRFAPAIGYRSQWFNYDIFCCDPALTLLDFNAQTAFINGRYQVGKWQFSAGVDYTRLFDQENYDEVYRELVPSVGIQRIFPVNDRLAFSASVQAGYHWTEVPKSITTPKTDINDRFDASLLLSMSWEVAPKLVVQPYYRFQYTDYAHFTDSTKDPVLGFKVPPTCRTDFIHSIGVNVTYYFTKNISARVFCSYEIKDSDYYDHAKRTDPTATPIYDYEKFDIGGGATLDFRF